VGDARGNSPCRQRRVLRMHSNPSKGTIGFPSEKSCEATFFILNKSIGGIDGV